MVNGNLLDSDLFEIYEYNGEKHISILGYAYCAGDSVTDNPDEIYRQVDYRDFDVLLKEYLSDEFDNDAVECGTRQYITDMTEEAVDEWFEDYKKTANPLLNELTMETPCGMYY